ncbi:MAG: hypothetical protein CMJ23_08940 [Phycisphaerae bacterium]|nr:hypothetical protein [Phycisphaerae bacterium]
MKISTANPTARLRPPGWGARIGSWLGVMVIVLAGVLVSPSTVDDLFNPGGPDIVESPTAFDSVRLTDFRAEPAPSPESARTSRFETAEDSSPQFAGREPLESATRRTATESAPREPVAIRFLRGVRSSLKMGLLRIRQARTLVEGRPADDDQRIPPSFIPSRS